MQSKTSTQGALLRAVLKCCARLRSYTPMASCVVTGPVFHSTAVPSSDTAHAAYYELLMWNARNFNGVSCANTAWPHQCRLARPRSTKNHAPTRNGTVSGKRRPSGVDQRRPDRLEPRRTRRRGLAAPGRLLGCSDIHQLLRNRPMHCHQQCPTSSLLPAATGRIFCPRNTAAYRCTCRRQP